MKEIITPIFRTISYPQTIVNHRVLIMYYVKCNKHDFINMTQYDFIDQSSRCPKNVQNSSICDPVVNLNMLKFDKKLQIKM